MRPIAIVGGVVYLEWPGRPHEQLSQGFSPTPSLVPEPPLDLPKKATPTAHQPLPKFTIGPPPAQAAPTITWTPASVTETFLPGESQTLAVSFVASETISNVAVRVVPELQPFVQVKLTSFSQLTKGQIVSLAITVSTAPTSSLGTFDGTIQLKSTGKSSQTFAKPLPVTISIVEPLSEPTLGDLVIQPLTITAQVPTLVFTEISIPDAGLIPQSIRLDRLDETGKVITTLGNLRDDGRGEDLHAGDKRFGLELTLNEPNPGLIRLRASVAFTGVLQRAFSTEQRIGILEPVADTGPEALLQTVSLTFFSASGVSELSPFFDDQSFQRIQQSVARGVPLATYGHMFQTARLEWKTADSAQFKVFIERSGKMFGATVSLKKFPEGWKIVD